MWGCRAVFVGNSYVLVAVLLFSNKFRCRVEDVIVKAGFFWECFENRLLARCGLRLSSSVMLWKTKHHPRLLCWTLVLQLFTWSSVFSIGRISYVMYLKLIKSVLFWVRWPSEISFKPGLYHAFNFSVLPTKDPCQPVAGSFPKEVIFFMLWVCLSVWKERKNAKKQTHKTQRDCSASGLFHFACLCLLFCNLVLFYSCEQCYTRKFCLVEMSNPYEDQSRRLCKQLTFTVISWKLWNGNGNLCFLTHRDERSICCLACWLNSWVCAIQMKVGH